MRKLTRRDLVWIVPLSATGGFFAWFGLRAWRIQFGKQTPGEPEWKPGPRVEVATLEDLPEVWSFRYFVYPLAVGELKSVLLRLPEPQPGGLSAGDAHFLALSRICTHQGCTVNFVPDPEAGAIAYNYRTDHPFLGCPCHFGAFDPLRAGAAVFGPPRFPLPRIRLELEGKTIYATGHEVPLRPLEGRAPARSAGS